MVTIFHTFTKVDVPRSILAGICLGIGFIVPALWWLGIGAITWALYATSITSSYKQLVWLLVIMWWTKSLCSLSWYWSIYPIEWLGISSHIHQFLLILLYWGTSSLWLAGGGIAFACIARFVFLQRFIPTWMRYSILPVVWVVCELIGGGTFALFSFGPGSIIESYFVSFGMVGYLLGTTSMGIWLAAVAGVYGLSFAVVSVASITLQLVLVKKIKYLVLFFVFLFIIGIWSEYKQLSYQRLDVSVVAIDTRFDAELLRSVAGEQEKIDAVRQAVDQAVGIGAAVILLPEDSRYLQSQYNSAYLNQAQSMFQFTHNNTTTILIDSGRETDETGATVLRANVFDGVGKKIWQFDKQFLVPQGEYIPYLYHVFFRLLGYRDVIDSIAQDTSYQPGALIQTADVPGYIPGVLFCFESVSPTGISKLQAVRTFPFVVHPISHSWFHSPTALWQQQDVMLQVQSRYSGVPIVSAANMARGKLYLPTGEIKTGTVVGSGERYTLREFQF